MGKLRYILEKNNTLFVSCFFTILLSIFLRSTIDIGSDTGFYIDLGKKIANGGKYYYDFFESNLPLSFYFYTLQHHFSDFFDINPIVTSEIFINFLGIFSLFFANKILEKDSFFLERKDLKNLLIIAFAISFFLRINALSTGEFGTKTSFVLLGLFIYIPYSLINKSYLTKKDLLARGSSMALIFCLKPHYGIFIATIEIYNLYKTKSLKFFLELDKIFATFLTLLYINFMLIYTPQYFEFMVEMWSQYYPVYANKRYFINNALRHLNNHIIIFSLIFTIFSTKKMSKEDVILSLFFAASSILLLTENIGTIDQEVIFFAITTICFSKFSYDFFSSKEFNFHENKFIILGLVFLPIFDNEQFFRTFFSLVNIWWIFAIACLTCNRSIGFKNHILLFFLTIISNASIFFLDKFYSLVNLFCFFIFLFLFERKYQQHFRKASIALIIVVVSLNSHVMNLYIDSIKRTIEKDTIHTAPNSLTDMMAFYIKKYETHEKDSHLVISNLITHNYPLLLNLQKENNSKYAISMSFDAFGFESKTIFSAKNPDRAFVYSYLLDDLKKQIQDKKTKIIFVNNNIIDLKNDTCAIGILEYYFKDPQFKKLFFENFYFKNRFVDYKKNKSTPEIRNIIARSDKLLSQDFEIYIRK